MTIDNEKSGETVCRLTRPLSLRFWRRKPKVDSSQIVAAIPALFPDATTMYFECTSSVEQDVIHFFENHVEEGDYLPRCGTLWPKSTTYRCKLTPEFVEGLFSICETHAVPEICDHFFVYSGKRLLLGWYDAFDDQLILSTCVDEATRTSIANMTGMIVLPALETYPFE